MYQFAAFGDSEQSTKTDDPAHLTTSLVASTMSSGTSTSTSTRGASATTSTSTRRPSTSTGGPSTSTSKYNRTKLHNLEHFTKVLGFTEMDSVKVKPTQQLILDSTQGTTHSLIYTEFMQWSCT